MNENTKTIILNNFPCFIETLEEKPQILLTKGDPVSRATFLYINKEFMKEYDLENKVHQVLEKTELPELNIEWIIYNLFNEAALEYYGWERN